MPSKRTLHLIELALALTAGLMFAGGWLTGQIYTTAHPPGFELLENYEDEISLIRFTELNGNLLEGSYEGKQPRFLLGESEELFVPTEKFQLDLGKI